MFWVHRNGVSAANEVQGFGGCGAFQRSAVATGMPSQLLTAPALNMAVRTREEVCVREGQSSLQ